MSIHDSIAAGQAAVAAAQATLDSYTAQLASEMAKLAALQPQFDSYDALEAAVKSTYHAGEPADMQSPVGAPEQGLLDMIAKGRALLG